MQNNKNSTILLSYLGYRAQAVVLTLEAVALLATELVLVLKLGAIAPVPPLPAGPLLQVGQLYVFDVLLENGDVLDWLPPPTHVGQ